MKYYVIAGERSGDLHGGNLLHAIKGKDKKAVFQGIGGDNMQNAGCKITLHYEKMSFMGFWEVLKNLSRVRKYLAFCKKDILTYSPDVVILIDYAGFNMRIARFLSGKNIPVYYYISPKVWAWNQKRALKIKKWVSRMFVILPFEKTFYEKFQYQVDYVGNPVCDAIDNHVVDESFVQRHNLPKSETFIALLPGSRIQEINHILPVFLRVAKHFPERHFLLAAVSTIPHVKYSEVKQIPNISLVYEDTYNLLAHSRAAIVTSGTATLETALWGVPQIVVYKTSSFSYLIARLVIQVPFISLVNLILNEELIKEFIQSECTPANIIGELRKIVEDHEYHDTVKNGYSRLKEILHEGNVSENAAEKMVNYLIATRKNTS